MALKTFLTCAGFKLFAEDLASFIDANQAGIEKILLKPLGTEETTILNRKLGVKNGTQVVLNILESYKEELNDRSPVAALTDTEYRE